METLSLIFIYAFSLLISILAYATCLWVGMKCASIYAGMQNGGQYCEYTDLVKVSGAAAAVSFIPYVGFIASWVVLYYLLHKETEAEAIELIIMVTVAQISSLLLLMVVALFLPIITAGF
jgi:hypothetical protein